MDLVAHGHAVTVLTGRRGYAENEAVYPREENYKGVKAVRVWPFSLGRKNKILRLLDAFFVNLSFAWRLLWMPRFDKVIAMTSPPLVGWVALLFSKRKGGEFVYWMMDVNPDEAIEAGWIKRESFAAGRLEKAL